VRLAAGQLQQYLLKHCGRIVLSTLMRSGGQAHAAAARHSIEFAIQNFVLRLDCIGHDSFPFDLTSAIIRADAATLERTDVAGM
jgi:hypothetical protein